MPLAPGTHVGPYGIAAPLGVGGTGEVYRAHDPRLGRDVAVKVLSPAFAADPDRLHRFEQEARAASALNHPNILTVYDIGTYEGAPSLVTELLEGESLRTRREGGGLEPRTAVDLALQVSSGLAAAHEKGIVHRDLKPIDPMAPMSYVPLMVACWLDGRFDAALDVIERARNVDPSFPLIGPMEVLLLILLGRREEAIAAAQPMEREEQLTILHRIALLWRYALTGDREKALSWMPWEAQQTCRRDLQYAWWVACAYVMLGDASCALEWLENAVELGFANDRYLGELDPVLAPLRGDARFQALMARARAKRTELEARRGARGGIDEAR